MRFLIRFVVNAVALAVTAWILPGITFYGDKALALLVVAVIFGLVNMIIKPIVQILTCPLTLLTLGLFTFVINALMLLLASWLSGLVGIGFSVDGFGTALIGSIIISLISFVLSHLLPDASR